MARDVMVVLIAPNGGGTLTAVEGLVRIWRSEGRDVTLLAAAPLRPERLDPQPSMQTDGSTDGRPVGRIDVVELADRPGPGTLTSAVQLIGDVPSLLRMIRIVRSHARALPDAPVLAFLPGTAILSLVACLGLGRRVVVCERNDPERQPMGSHVRRLRRSLYPLAAAITVNAVQAGDWARRVGRGRPVHVVPNPPPVGGSPADPVTSRTVLCVGRLVDQKDHVTAIEAFARALPRLADTGWRLAIVGDGPLREDLRRVATGLGVAQRVDLVGHVDDPSQWYADAAVFVLPSRFEGASNALAEAMAAGLPCIVSDTVHTDSAPRGDDGRAGPDGHFRTFPVGDPDALAVRLVELLQDPDLRARLGAMARRAGAVDPEDVRASWDTVLAGARPARRSARTRLLRAGKVALGAVHPLTAPLRTDLAGDLWSWAMRLRFRLRPPRTFQDKVRWKSAHDRDPLLTRTADKWEVRGYVEERIGAEHLARSFGVLERASDILTLDLPARFVVKATHGSSATLFVDDRLEAGLRIPRVTRGLGWPGGTVRIRRLEDDPDGVVRLLDLWIASRYDQRAFRAPEWSYRDVPHRLIVEELLEGSDGAPPEDHKFWCVHGAVEFVVVHQSRHGDHRASVFARSGAPRAGRVTAPRLDVVPKLPESFPRMVELAEVLAAPFDFVRVDMYALPDGRIVVGELTHTPKGGRLVLEPAEAFADIALGWHPGRAPSRRLEEVPG